MKPNYASASLSKLLGIGTFYRFLVFREHLFLDKNIFFSFYPHYISGLIKFKRENIFIWRLSANKRILNLGYKCSTSATT